jgi:CBS domain containing-hemolysin-like protein
VRGRDSITFPGELRPDELQSRTGVQVPEGEVYDTVAGYVMSVLERVPVPGDEVTLDSGVLQVVRMDGRRVDRLRYTPTPVDAAIEEGTR